MEDSVLLREYLKKRDVALLGSLYHKYMTLVYGVALKYLCDPDLAQDAVMDIFEKLHRRAMNPTITDFKGYLYIAARNHCYEELRKKQPLKISDSEINNMHFIEESRLDVEEDEVFLTKCLEKLDHDQLRCIQLFYMDKNSYSDIATQLNVDFNYVRSRIQNGRRNLKNCIQTMRLTQ